MDILIIQENGRHNANKDFRECFCIKRALEKFNKKVKVWGLGHDNFYENINFNKFDIIVNLENYNTTNWIPDLSKTNKPIKFLWCIDAHTKGTEIYKYEFYKNKYHKTLQSTYDFLRDIPESVWLPNAFDDSIIKPLNISKTINLGFCGNYATKERKAVLDFLTQSVNLKKDIFVIGQKMVETINSYKIHFNMNISNDINYRNFETIGCKTVLCTNKNHQYEKLGFIDMQNCILYSNLNEAIEKIEFVLKTNNILDEIASKGYQLSFNHTYEERAKTILNEFYVFSV